MRTSKNELVKETIKISTLRSGLRKRWYAIVVRANNELKAEQEFRDMGYEAFVPTRADVHHWSDRDRLVYKRYFPLMVFVRLKQLDLVAFRGLRRVVRLVTVLDNLHPFTIPFRLIISLQRAHNYNLVPEPPREPNIQPRAVRVYRGPLRAINAEAIYADAEKTQIRLGAPPIGYVYFTVDSADLEPRKKSVAPHVGRAKQK